MAKKKYKVRPGVDSNKVLRGRGFKINVSDLTQQTMKVFFDAGHPDIILDEGNVKKEK